MNQALVLGGVCASVCWLKSSSSLLHTYTALLRTYTALSRRYMPEHVNIGRAYLLICLQLACSLLVASPSLQVQRRAASHADSHEPHLSLYLRPSQVHRARWKLVHHVRHPYVRRVEG